MRSYSISQQGLRSFHRRMVRGSIIQCLFTVGFVVFVALSQAWTNNWPLALPLVPGLFVILTHFSFKSQRAILESIRVEIDGSYIARQQLRVPKVSIAREEVTAMHETEDGLVISTANKFRSLLIPIQLDGSDYQEIRAILSTWAPIRPKLPQTKAKNTLLMVAIFAGFAVIFLSELPWLVLLVSLIMAGVYGYYFWLVQRIEGVDPRFKRYLLLILGFLALATILRLYSVFAGARS